MLYLIALNSITYALKAENILKEQGFYCVVQRTPKNFSSGCGYSIRVKGNIDIIIKILERNNIQIKAISEVGALNG